MSTQNKISSNYQSLLVNLGALLTWFTLITQLVVMLQSTPQSTGAALVQFFSYFTILTNIWVALFFTLQFFPDSKWYTRLTQNGRETALAIYITMVALVYQVLLRPVFNPQGLQLIIDQLLHGLIPFFYLYYWFTFVDKSDCQYSKIFPWSTYLLVYAAYILIRGAVYHIYPYPFIDVTVLGYPKALLHTLGVFIFYVLAAVAFIIVAKRTPRNG